MNNYEPVGRQFLSVNIFTGESSGPSGWHAAAEMEQLKKELRSAWRHRRQRSSRGFTAKSVRVLRGLYNRIAELAETFHVTCELRVEERFIPAENIPSEPWATLKCTYTMRDGDQVQTRTFDIFVEEDDEDPRLHYDDPVPFRQSERDSETERSVYPNGWTDSDARNFLCSEAFDNAMQKVKDCWWGRDPELVEVLRESISRRS